MTLAIGATPAPTPYSIADVPITLTLAVAGGLHPNWVGEPGSSFSSRHTSPTTFLPPNETGETTVKGYRVKWLVDTGMYNNSAYTGIVGTGPGTVEHVLGTNATWSAGLLLNGVSGSQYFLEVKVTEINVDKFFGFSADGTGAFGTVPTDTAIKYAWHFTGELAYPRKNGVVIGDAVSVEAGDVFKIHANYLNEAVYYKNDVVIATTTGATGAGNNPVFCFKDFGSFTDVVLYDDGYVTPALDGNLTFDTYGVFPVQPNYAYETNLDNNTLISRAEDGTSTFRVKGTTSRKKTLSLQFNSRPFSEFQLLYNFWMYHQKHIRFYYRDLVYDETYLMVHDSGLKYQASGPDQITISVVLREI